MQRRSDFEHWYHGPAPNACISGCRNVMHNDGGVIGEHMEVAMSTQADCTTELKVAKSKLRYRSRWDLIRICKLLIIFIQLTKVFYHFI